MITLNLLSPKQKKELKTKRIYLALKELLMLFLLFTALIAILLIVSRYFLEQQLASLITRNINAIQISQKTNEEVVLINKKINNVYKIQKNFQKWSDFLTNLSKLTPAGVSYNLVKIYQQNSQLEIQGIAKTRNDLLELKKNLEADERFYDIDLPLNNLLVKENNSFTIGAKIKSAVSQPENGLPKK
ncbi:MAG: PilN domain-containing protein [Patescibacteria group bacterium]